jgi:hypothetical protein
MSVVLRCPTCGTTQGQGGECEACSEGEVRYFCPNHDGGTWLDGPVCSRCGATFAVEPKKPRTPTVSTPPAGAPDFRPPGARHPPGSRSESDFGGRPRTRTEREAPADPEVLPRTPSLGELLREMIDERARARAGYEADEVPWVEPRIRPPAFPVGGCLVRIVGLLFLVIVAVVILLSLLFGGLVSY